MKKILKMCAVFSLVSMCSVNMTVNANAGESKSFYTYYNDANTNYTTDTNTFQKYTNWYYSAKHTSRSATNVYTLMQPGYGTSFQKPSYLVNASKIKFLVTAASSSYVYVNSVLSYNTAPASTSGTIVRPSVNTSSVNDGE